MEKRFNLIGNIIGLVIIGASVIWIFSYIKHAFSIMAGSILLAYLIKPPVDFLCKYGLNIKNWRKKETPCKGLSRTLAIVIMYIILLTFIILFLSFALPKINNEASNFVNNFPELLKTIQENLENVNTWLKPRLPLELQDSFYLSISKGLEELGNTVVNIAKKSFSIIGTIFSTIASIFIIPLFAFLFLKDIDKYNDWILSLFPMAWRKEIRSILSDIDKGLGGFIRGQLLVSICIGTTIIISLSLWNVNYAVLIGTIAGILNMIPFAGPILGSIPAIILAFADSPPKALGVLITFLVIHEIEKQIISPTLVGHSVGLPTLVVLISIMISGELMGVIGILIAVPSAIVLKVLFLHFHEKWAQTWPENNTQEMQISEIAKDEETGKGEEQ